MKQSYFLFLLITILFNFNSLNAQNHVPFSTRLPQGNMEVKGDLVLVGNNVLNRETTINSANVPYIGTGNNNSFNMQYIDIDDDINTFSSSSADLEIPLECKRIVYAGLYWGGIYSAENDAQNNPVNIYPDWNQVKFKVPGGNYIDLVADTDADPVNEEDDIIFGANESSLFDLVPYVCYKNVTSLLQGLSDANGTFTIANVRATRGIDSSQNSRPGGSGWNLVIIYESPNSSTKNISVFDGLISISSGDAPIETSVDGFLTPTAPTPVRASLGVGAFEGDRAFIDDRLKIKTNLNTNFTTISDAVNYTNNFFNSTISNYGVIAENRTPNSSNTLGFDLDLVAINNPSNSVLPNDETGMTVQFSTSGDTYSTFLFTFAIEVAEPNILVTQTVEDNVGTDITSESVSLCQDLVYVLKFQNVGTDDAINTTIKKVLPLNITFDPNTDLVLPSGIVLSSYDAETRTLLFTIDDYLVTQNSSQQELRINAKVVCSCLELDTSCTNTLSSEGYATYNGLLNTAVFSDEINLSSFGCTANSFSTVNALTNLESCNTSSVVYLCNSNVILSATNGYDTYIWNSSTGNSFVAVNATNNQYVEVSEVGMYEVQNTFSGVICRSINQSFEVKSCIPSNFVVQNGNRLSAFENNETYQWIDCDTNLPIDGETNQEFEATTTGNYAVVITNGIGNSVTSDCFSITVLSNEVFEKKGFLIYPNPTTDSFKVETDFNIQKLIIYNLLGQEVKTFKNNENVFSITELNKGTYVVEIITEKGKFTTKISKN